MANPNSDSLRAAHLQWVRLAMEAEGMKCPRCDVEVHDSWVSLAPVKTDDTDLTNPIFTVLDQDEIADGLVPVELTRESLRFQSVCYASLMYCPRKECRGAIFAVTQHWRGGGGFAPGLPSYQTERRIVYPWGFGSKRAGPDVPEPYRRDFEEAAAILAVSPRMSAVLSRRILADLLEEFAGEDNYRLSNRVENFTKDSGHPRRVRENVNILRSIADFGAHTKRDKDDQAVILDVTSEEAEWTLGVVERLFDYFIVEPSKDAAMRDGFNQKRIEAGQNPLPELAPDEGSG